MSESTLNETQQAFAVQNAMAQARSPNAAFQLPCGVFINGELVTEVEVREITGAEEDFLNAKNIDGTKKMTNLLGSCLVRVGPVTDREEILRLMREMTIGDRVFLLFAVRRTTFGDELPCEEKCPECGKSDLYSADLGQLTVKKMADPAKRIYDVTLPSGRTARFHVMTGKDEERFLRVDTKDQGSAVLLSRLDMYNGAPVTLETLKSMSMRDRNYLRDQFEEVEGGVDTGLEFECSNCGNEFQTELNPGSTGFFFPSRVRKTLRRSTSAF